jgi:hypothetical protein
MEVPSKMQGLQVCGRIKRTISRDVLPLIFHQEHTNSPDFKQRPCFDYGFDFARALASELIMCYGPVGDSRLDSTS